VNTVAQSVYPVLAPVVVFLIIYAIQKFLAKPDELSAAVEEIRREMGKQEEIDALKEEMRQQVREFEDKLHEQERESWTKIGSLNELVIGLRGDIKYLQSRINGTQWKSQP